MTDRLTAAIDAWRQADAEARAAENLLAQAWEDFDARRGPPVSAQLIAQVARLRDQANDRLTVALSLLQQARKP